MNNLRQLSGCLCTDYNESEPVHLWDNGNVGNFWSDYNGTDSNSDGIGDTPYVIDVLNMDRYPLATSLVAPPKMTPIINLEFPVAVALIAVVAVVLAVVLWHRQKKKI